MSRAAGERRAITHACVAAILVGVATNALGVPVLLRLAAVVAVLAWVARRGWPR